MARKIKHGAISNFRLKKEAQLAKIKSRQDKLEEQLRAAVPGYLYQWLNRDGNSVFFDLFKTGKAMRCYWKDGEFPNLYKFSDLKEFAHRFKELRAAWKGVVKIRISWDHDYNFGIDFKAL